MFCSFLVSILCFSYTSPTMATMATIKGEKRVESWLGAYWEDLSESGRLASRNNLEFLKSGFPQIGL